MATLTFDQAAADLQKDILAALTVSPIRSTLDEQIARVRDLQRQFPLVEAVITEWAELLDCAWFPKWLRYWEDEARDEWNSMDRDSRNKVSIETLRQTAIQAALADVEAAYAETIAK